ncbi:MAG TPA: cation transporter [Bacteroidia bacterium]|jgi:copper chaperone|nr:cation transporter [Bacteroidia bacterium]
MATVTEDIKVSGMTCGHCEMTVNKAITGLGDGIVNVKVDRNTGTATVSYNDSKISRAKIVEAVNATEIYSAS